MPFNFNSEYEIMSGVQISKLHKKTLSFDDGLSGFHVEHVSLLFYPQRDRGDSVQLTENSSRLLKS